MLTISKKALPSGVAVLELTGRITIGRDCQELEWEVDRLLQAGQKQVIFDMAKVTHMDSTGIGIVVLCSGRLKEAGGALRVAGATGLVEKVLRMTSVDSLVPLDDSTETADRKLAAAAS